MSGVRIKICGITDVADGIGAVDSGADYIGVVFAERARRVRPAEAASVIRAVYGRAHGVGVFVDETEDDLLGYWSVVGFDIAQLHGSESADLCDRLRTQGLGVWKAIRPRSRDELMTGLAEYSGSVDAILIEGFSTSAAGGTGTAFPHEWLDGVERTALPDIVLAGGLDPDNVAVAIAAVAPDIVDVSSGVESAPGRKSTERVDAFIHAARTAS
ncbi:MAG: phosphoribosylanthranilate isomerase [Gemmatimonadota bacterium]|nr:phosphoribosylanthranilate isomerase [Gemmatimonadota bacterium]